MRLILALLVLASTSAHAEDRLATVEVDGRGTAAHHADAAVLATADGRVRAVRQVAARLLKARKREGATRLLQAMIGVDPAPFIVHHTAGTPRWHKPSEISVVRSKVTVDERVVAERWCRVAAGALAAAKRVHAFKLDVRVDGRAEAFVVGELRKGLKSAKLRVGSGGALGDEAVPTAKLVQRASDAKIDVVFRGSFTTSYDGAGKEASWSYSIGVIDVARGASVASLRNRGHLVLNGVSLKAVSLKILRDQVVPKLLGNLANSTLLATREAAAFALRVEGADKEKGEAIAAWLSARADVCGLVKPALDGDTWTVGVLGTFREKDLTKALLAKRAPIVMHAKQGKNKTGLILVVGPKKQKKAKK